MMRMLVRFRERFEWRHPGGDRLAAPGPGAGECAGPGHRQQQPGRNLAGLPTELGRGLGLGARQRLGHRDDRLGDARPRRRRAQPARHQARRQLAGRLPALAGQLDRRGRRARPHDPRPRGGRGRPPQPRRPRPGRGARQAPAQRRLLRRGAGLAREHRLRDRRPSHRRLRRHPAVDLLARQRPETRRRLGRHPRRSQQRRRDRRRDPGDPQLQSRPERRSPTCASTAQDGGWPLGRDRPLEQPVDRLGRPGPDRRRRRRPARRSTTSPRCRRPTGTTATRARKT